MRGFRFLETLRFSRKVSARARDDRGNVAVLTAILMVVLLGSTALVTDVGTEFAAEQKLWNALDAGALAGIEVFFSGTQAAVSTATQYVSQNGETVSKVAVDTANNTITLYGNRQVPLYFAKVLGFSQANISAKVTAKAGTLVSGTGFAPLAVVEQNFQYGQSYTLSLGAGSSSQSGGAGGSCGNGSDGAEMRDGGETENGGQSEGSDGSETQGGGETGSDASGQDSCTGAGNYGFLALGAPGAQQFEQNLMYGYSGVLSVGEQVQTETGVMAGPAAQAIDYRMSEGADCSFATASDNCPRVLLLPVVNTLDVNGKSSVTIVGFAAFYLDGISGSGGQQQIMGRFLQMVVPGTIGQGTNFGLFGVRLTT